VRLSYLALAQTLADRLSPYGGVMEQGEMALPQAGTDRLLSTALFARWRAVV
jgi:23S rRNA (cytosine1962-C5)-methyltransferase